MSLARTADPASIPSGIITFLFTDVEGSTRLWAADAEATARSLERHDTVIKECITSRGGYVFGWAGDHFRGAFEDPKAAVGAAVAAQRALAETDWDGGPNLKVRMGLHRGRATQRDGDYFGPVPNTAARLEAIAAGGQILLTDAVASTVDVETVALGRHRLRDVPEPVGIHQVGLESFRPLEVIDPNLSTLPNPGSPIIGRHDEIARIRQLLDSQPMVTLTGPGGCGKTRVAVEVAYQELPSRGDGCYFADLSAVSDGSELPAALATAVRLEVGGSRPLDQVVDHLAHRDALLLLDNCEHILDDCADFAERLLARSTSTAVLATTRQRLDVAGEAVVAIGSLAHGGGAGPAVELFVERARTANPSFTGTPDTLATAAEICEHLDGMPLPIELAAARVAVLTPREILDRMADRFRLLSGGRGRHRRRTLQATLDWSYDLLDADEQRFFERCGVFVGSFDLAGAVAVSGAEDYEAIDLLESLVAKSLIAIDETQDNPTTRYRLLETIRIYAGDQLARAEEVAEARDAHLRHFAALAVVDDFRDAACLGRAERLRHDWPNIASALEWAMSLGDYDTAGRMAFGCQGVWETRVPATEGRRWVQQIRRSQAAGPCRDWLTYIDAVLAMQLDEFPDVHRILEGMVDDADPLPRAQALGLYAFLKCRQFPDEAVELAERGRALVAEHGLPGEFLCPSVWAEACLALYEARYEDALEGFGVAHGLLVDSGRPTNHRVATGLSLASAMIVNDDPGGALALLDRLDRVNSIWDSSPIVRALALIDLGRPGDAADLVVGFGYDALRGRLSRMANDAMVGLAALAVNRGEKEHGWELLQQGVAPRTPFTIGLAEVIADRIGHGDDLRGIHRGRDTPLIEMDATSHLRAELDRMRLVRR